MLEHPLFLEVSCSTDYVMDAPEVSSDNEEELDSGTSNYMCPAGHRLDMPALDQ